MAKYEIKIEKDNRKEIVVEDISSTDNNNPLFQEEYLKAKRILESFTKDISISESEDSKNCDKKNCDKKYITPKNYGTKNNIIVFTGDRGTGKTSAMVSFGEYLKENGIKISDKKAPGCKLLDMIDPSYFRKNESILLNVITMMFKMAKEYHRNCNSKYHEDCDRYNNKESNASDFNKLLEEFEKVFRAVKRMDSLVPKEDSLEYLNELSDAIDLNKTIHDLIDKFLRFFKGTPRYLVLMIDDLDMNVAYAATMLEQIRKFLIQDNVIILIATNVDQLQFEMKESYSKYYDKTLHPYQQQANVSVDVEDMANKYLLKLFPPLQRIHISDAANKLIDTKLKIDDIKDEKGNLIFNDNLQKVILNLIWKKTRLIFIPEKEQLHPIIPTNLRALHQLVYILLDMEDLSKDISDKIFKDIEDYEKAHVNFNKFKDYILNVWIPSNVSFEEQKVFDNIPKDISRINKHLIQSINIIGSKYKKSILAKEIEPNELFKDDDKIKFDRDIYTFVSPNDPKFPHANKISDVINFPSNNAAGDILLLIDKYKTYFEAANQNNFIEAVKIYYSLLLFETMFFGSVNPIKNINIKDKFGLQLENGTEKIDIKLNDTRIVLQVNNIEFYDKKLEKNQTLEAIGKTITLFGVNVKIHGNTSKNLCEITKKIETAQLFQKRVFITAEKINLPKENVSHLAGEKFISIEGGTFNVELEGIEINVEETIIEDIKNISNIQKLIGGTLFFPHYFTIIKNSNYEKLKEIKREDDNLIKKLENLLLKYDENTEKSKQGEFEKDLEDIFEKATNTALKIAIKRAIGSNPTVKKLQEEIEKWNIQSVIKLKKEELEKNYNDKNTKQIKKTIADLINEPSMNLYVEELKKVMKSIDFLNKYVELIVRLERLLENTGDKQIENRSLKLKKEELEKNYEEKNTDQIKKILGELIKEPSMKGYIKKIEKILTSIEVLNEYNDLIKTLNSLLGIGKSEPSENHLFYHSFNDFEVDSLFYIVYYGRKRPERSYGIQIYDTKAEDIENESNYRYRFDILSLLVNTLNPYQTLARFEYNNSRGCIKENRPLNSLKDKVIDWYNVNMIEKTILHPNSILPIYSVDLMLRYLKKQFDANEIDSNFKSKMEEIDDNEKIGKMEKMEEHVRTPYFISKYYGKLKELTETYLNEIELSGDKEISNIYNAIYDKGKECFMQEYSK